MEIDVKRMKYTLNIVRRICTGERWLQQISPQPHTKIFSKKKFMGMGDSTLMGCFQNLNTGVEHLFCNTFSTNAHYVSMSLDEKQEDWYCTGDVGRATLATSLWSLTTVIIKNVFLKTKLLPFIFYFSFGFLELPIIIMMRTFSRGCVYIYCKLVVSFEFYGKKEHGNDIQPSNYYM